MLEDMIGLFCWKLQIRVALQNVTTLQIKKKLTFVIVYVSISLNMWKYIHYKRQLSGYVVKKILHFKKGIREFFTFNVSEKT